MTPPPEEKRFALDHDDSWCCTDCGEGKGIYIDLETPVPGGGGYLRCALCHAIDGICEQDDLDDMLGCLP